VVAFLRWGAAMANSAREEDPDPVIEVLEPVEERTSRTRVRSARRPTLVLDEDERPTLVPDEPVDATALEARVLFESRAAMERRYAIATQQDLQATRRIDAVILDEPVHISVDPSALDAAFDRRRTRVRAFALSLMLMFVAAIAFVAFRK